MIYKTADAGYRIRGRLKNSELENVEISGMFFVHVISAPKELQVSEV
jgi:hypothetical protein